MAVSPLAQIDWDNLEGEDSNTVMLLLQKAFNERMVVACINNRQPSQVAKVDNFFPFPDSAPTNSPTWGTSGTPSLWHWSGWTSSTSGSAPMMRFLASRYMDMTYINDNMGLVVPEIDVGGEDDITLSESKIWAYIGITEWPAVINPNAVELKQWYDILKLLTHVYVTTTDSFPSLGADGAQSIEEHGYSGIYQGGVFPDPATSSTVVKYGLVDGDGWPPLSQYTTDWASLITGPNTLTYSSDFNHPDVGILNNGEAYRANARTGTQYDLAAYRRYLRLNITDLDNTTYSRSPKATTCVGYWDIGITPTGITNNDPVKTAAYLSTNNMVDKKLITFTISDVTTASYRELSTTETVLPVPSHSDGIGFDALKLTRFIDEWNDNTGASGFEFYTP